MASSSQIKQIHTLKSVLFLDDDLYRDMLMSFGVQSSKNLTDTEAGILLSILKENAKKLNRWKEPALKYNNLNRDKKMATGPQLRKIEAMWKDICYHKNDDFAKKSLRKFLKNKFNCDDLMFLSKNEAIKVINGLSNIKKN